MNNITHSASLRMLLAIAVTLSGLYQSKAQGLLPDMIAGVSGGTCDAYRNTGSCSAFTMSSQSSWNVPDVGASAGPGFGDLDGDGDYDLIVARSGINATASAFENTGTGISPTWTAKPAWDLPNTTGIGAFRKVDFADLDDDGDLDVLIGHSNGYTYAFRNTGTRFSPSWSYNSGWNPPNQPANAAPCLVDLDLDGDYDLLIGKSTSTVVAYRNTGSTSSPTWTANSSWNISSGTTTNAFPAIVDRDCDGDWDVYVGSSTTAYFHRNTGNVTSPTWSYTSGSNITGLTSPAAISFPELNEGGASVPAPDYVFINPSLQSGTALLEGAVYRFSNARYNTDVLVTIYDLNAATVSDIDNTSTGFISAFQPTVVINGSSNGYVEFQLDFVAAGTSTLVTQVELAPTSVDLDGSSSVGVYESDRFYFSPAGQPDYNTSGSEISVTQSGNWTIGTNTAGIEHAGIEATNKDVMFTAVAYNENSVNARVGANNSNASSQSRQRSIYFKRFVYESSFLPISLISFEAEVVGSTVDLNWSTSVEVNSDFYTVERSQDGTIWSEVGRVASNINSTSIQFYQLVDESPLPGGSYYRLKQTDIDGSSAIHDYAVVIRDIVETVVNVKPNTGSSCDILITSPVDANINIHLISMSGAVVFEKTLHCQAHEQRGITPDMELPQGVYLVAWNSGVASGTHKITIAN